MVDSMGGVGHIHLQCQCPTPPKRNASTGGRQILVEQPNRLAEAGETPSKDCSPQVVLLYASVRFLAVQMVL